jgi:hypothetical protein
MAMPVLPTQCHANTSVDADSTGTVCINGNKGRVKKLSVTDCEPRHAKVTIGIQAEPGAASTKLHVPGDGAIFTSFKPTVPPGDTMPQRSTVIFPLTLTKKELSP